MPARRDNVQDVFDTYCTAVYEKDVDAYIDLYSKDVHVFDAWGDFEVTGLLRWREMTEAWFGSLGDERVPVTFSTVEIRASGDVAFAHAAVTFAGETAGGERLREMTNRFTFGLCREDDGWKIVHQHSSLPIDMATMKANLG
ncbi:MAG TPA: nuclear transport factor 2 family protein [Thermomicrobiales bacterium]|nr:nuclear transport factor 2 family protein [Thermomicrobiales bacterium]